MYVKVAPILRMPRSLGAYDYRVPEDLTVKVGSFVLIPFRKRVIRGVVVELMDRSEFKRVLDIQEVIDIPPLDVNDIAFYTSLAKHLYESIETILYASVPSFLKRKTTFVEEKFDALGFGVSKEDVVSMQKIVEGVRDADFADVCVPSDKVSIGVLLGLLRSEKSPILVVVPDLNMARQVAGVASSIVDNVAVYGGTMNKTTAFVLWNRLLTSDFRLIVSTRIGALSAVGKDVRIIVLACGEDDHCQIDQRPHYDVRWCALERRRLCGNRVLMMGTFPRLEDGDITLNAWRYPRCEIVDMRQTEVMHEYYYISDRLIRSIKESDVLNKPYFVYFNRKGDARMMICEDCGSSAVCGNCSLPLSVDDGKLACFGCRRRIDMPKTCPTCQSYKLTTRGVGNKQLAKVFRTMFDGIDVHLVEAGDDIPGSGICVVTRRILYGVNFVRPFLSGLCVIRAEHECVMRGFRSIESANRLFRRLSSFASTAGVDCIFQTWAPGIIEDALGDTFALYDEDRKMRKILGYPPFKKLVVFNDGARKVYKIEDDEIVEELLTAPVSCDILVNPY